MFRHHLLFILAAVAASAPSLRVMGATALDFDLPAQSEASVEIYGSGSETGLTLVALDGDFNGDGRNDPVVATRFQQSNPNLYVLWQNPLPAAAQINGVVSLGTVILSATGQCGYLPDVNGDGADELLISNGGPGVAGGLGSGIPSASIIYGSTTPGAQIDLGGGTTPPGVTSIAVERSAPQPIAISIASAGDIDNSGKADVILGDGAFGSTGEGRAYVIFGETVASPTQINLSGLTPPAGFVILGRQSGEALGLDVQGRVDLNADTFTDVMVSGLGAYAIFGHSPPFNSPLDISALGSAGVTFLPMLSPGSFYQSATPGDLSGDGVPDLVLFGGGGAATNLTLIPGQTGLSGTADLATFPSLSDSGTTNVLRPARGRSGDLNNDRQPDLALGEVLPTAGQGESSVLLITDPLTAPADLSSLAGREAIRLRGEDTGGTDVGDSFGATIGVADMDGDGFPDLVVSAPGDDTPGGSDAGALYVIPFTPPAVASAYLIDANNNGLADADESVIVEFNRQCVFTPPLIDANYFRLTGVGDDFGGAGFNALPLLFSDRRVRLNLGAGASIDVPGQFPTSSGLDISAAGFVPEAVNSHLGVNATDLGVPDVDDAGIDVLYSMVQNSQVVPPAAGVTVQVTQSPDALYTEHRMTLPPNSLAESAQVTLATPSNGQGVGSSVHIDIAEATPTDGVLQFLAPFTLTMGYRDRDFAARSLGQVEDQMRIVELIQVSPGVFQYLPLPGAQQIDTANNLISVTIPPSGFLGFGSASSSQASPSFATQGVGNSGFSGTFATLPVETVDENRIWITASGAAAAAGLLAAGPDAELVPGPMGVYLNHRIVFPGWEIDPTPDASSLQVTIRTPTLLERQGGVGPTQDFPAQSGAVFTIEVEDFSGNPAAFTDPVTMEIEYIARPQNSTTDCVDFDSVVGSELQMRGCASYQSGPPDYALIGSSFAQSVDPVNDLVTVNAYTPLTTASGVAQFGAVIDPSIPAFTAAGGWEVYR